MPRNSQQPVGELAQAFADRFEAAAKACRRLPGSGARNLPVVRGLAPDGSTTDNFENCMERIAEILKGSARVYAYGGELVFEKERQGRKSLQFLTSAECVEKCAPGMMANLFICEQPRKDGSKTFPPTSRILEVALMREPLRGRLPHIKHYANRPVFNEDFHLCGPGWHEASGILCHGIEVSPILPEAAADRSLPALERLPPHLRELLGGFCFASDADLANAVGILVTGMLMSHFTNVGHPLVLLDGNQPGVGKTLFARTVGSLLDGREPFPIKFSLNDEEMGKQIVSTLRGSVQTCLLFDNARTGVGQPLSSAVIESMSMAPEISLRVLGTSTNYTRTNDLLWFVTMNNTQANADLVSRAVPIRLRHEGATRNRKFRVDPIEYAREHRAELFGELAGWVMHWNSQGRQQSKKSHRCRQWAAIVGGIMEVNGLGEFLGNQDEAAAEFNSELNDLAALAEAVLRERGPLFVGGGVADRATALTSLMKGCGKAPGEWEEYFSLARVNEEGLANNKSKVAKGKLIGNFLSKHCDKPVTVDYSGREQHAVLRRCDGRAGAKLYAFQIVDPGRELRVADAPPDETAWQEEVEYEESDYTPPPPLRAT